MRKTPSDDEIRFGTERRWKGKRLLTKAEKLAIQRAYTKKWRALNRQKMIEYFREYRAAHPELKISQAAYYREHKDKWDGRARSADAKKWRREHRRKNAIRLNAARRDWNRKNPERAKAIERRSREKRREQKRLSDRLYRQQKPEIYKASIARAKAAKPELYKQIAVKSSLIRRARKKALPVERVSLKRIVARDRGLCHLCSRHVERRDRGDEDQGKTLMDSLPSLPIGDAWFWSPGWPTVEGIFKRVHVLPIETFDSGASPAPGVKPVEPKNLADVDLNALKGQMAATIEKAKADVGHERRKRR